MNIAEETEDTTSVLSGLSDTVQQLEENFLVQLHEFMTLQLFNLQNTPVTMYSLIMFLFFLSIFAIGGKVISRVLFFRMLGNVQMDEGIRYTLMRFTNYFVMFIGVVISFQFIGIDLSGLAVIFGLLSVGIGFGLQNVTSNFIAGLILLIERPIKIGDRIIVNDMEGDVKEINMRSTTIQSLLNISIIVPNADFISGSVVNYSYGGDTRVRVRVNVGVSYSSNLDLVLRCLREAAMNHPEVMQDPPPVVVFRDFGDSSWDLSVTSWINDAKRHIIVASEIRMNIVRIFKEHDIEIPFPQRDINFRNIMEMKSDAANRPLKPGEADES